MSRKADIKFSILLDQDRMPERIDWDATDSGNADKKECEAILISLWDKKAKETLGIDLWTKNMKIDDMNIFIHQTLLKISNTYSDATHDKETSQILNRCAEEFASKLNLFK